MGNKEDNKSRSFSNDLDRHSTENPDPDFDLDEYIHQQSQDDELNLSADIEEKEDRSQFKNAVLIFIVFAASFLWFHDWSPTQAWSAVFGGGQQVAEVTTGASGSDQVQSQIPNIPQPPAPPGANETAAPTASELDMPITEYLSILREKGYLGNEVSSFDARQLYNANVPISYLDELQNQGFLEDLSFVDVTEFYNNDVTIDYLVSLNEAGYLEELSFVYITSFYNAGVTLEFLDQLKEQGLYQDLNFLDIVDLYQRENGG
jgi:hypothetical protein